MKPSLVQLTLRRWAEIATSRHFHLLFAGFVILGTLFGPYGTFNELGVVGRFWITLQINVVCWIVGIIVIVPIRLALQQIGVPFLVALVVSCLAGAATIMVCLSYLLTVLVDVHFDWTQVAEHGVLITALLIMIALAMFGSSNWRQGNSEKASPDDDRYNFVAATPRDPDRCPLQSRLPKEKRGILYAMVAQDHYVEMITDKGSELVLMRLSDAAEQANPKYGMRIHRSAWISVFGVAELAKHGRQSFVRLRNGRELPVSRSSESDLKSFFETASNEDSLVTV